MEANDALAEGAPEADPFDEVEADAGEGEELVAPGSLPGYNPSEEEAEGGGDDPLAEPEGDPLAEPAQGEFMEDPEPEDDEPEPQPTTDDQPAEPGPEPDEPAAEAPENVPEPAEEPAEEPAPEPSPEPEPQPEGGKSERQSARRKPKKGEREYVVVQCDKKDKPIGIAGEVIARDDKGARRQVFEKMEDKTAHLCAVPARYWNVKTLTAEVEEVRKVSEK